jgi:hypothetical protein
MPLNRKHGFILFWSGEFSQWHLHDMYINDVKYNCCEQYMMAMKAKLFNDDDSYRKIMESQFPREQKALGRKVKNYDDVKWKQHCRQFVFHGNYAKFEDPILRGLLLTTWDDTIVEASPYDTIWGIGMGEDNPRCYDPSQWLGTNWLGEALMQVRGAIRTGYKSTKVKYGL